MKYTTIQDNGALIIVSVPPIVEMEQAHELFEDLRIAYKDRQGLFSCIVDCTQVTHIPDSNVRRAVSEFDRSLAKIDEQWNAGSATVVPNAAVRGAMTAVYWLAPPVYPHRFFGSLSGAVEWCRGELAKTRARRRAQEECSPEV